MESIFIYPQKKELMQFYTIFEIIKKIYYILSEKKIFTYLGDLKPYSFDSDNKIKKIENLNSYFKTQDFIFIYPEKADIESSIKLSYINIVPNSLNVKKDIIDINDKVDKFIHENKLDFFYAVNIGIDHLDKAMCKIMTLAIALLTEGIIDLDGSGFIHSKLIVTPNEFAKDICGITEEELKKIIS